MLTIFTIPKPFEGHNRIIQINAIKSWKFLKPECEIFILGDDDGVNDVSNEFDINHFPEIKKNSYGTPLINDAFEIARINATHDYLCYVNADIILTNDILNAIHKISSNMSSFVAIGKKWRAEINSSIVFDDTWFKNLDNFVKIRCFRKWEDELLAMDFFVFPKRLDIKLPPMAVGRPWWDTWYIYQARHKKIPVVDISAVNIAVHQEHDYNHVPDRRGIIYHGPESDENENIFKEMGTLDYYGFNDATHILTKRGLKRAIGLKYLRRHIDTIPVFHPRLKPLAYVGNKLVEITRPARMFFRKKIGK